MDNHKDTLISFSYMIKVNVSLTETLKMFEANKNEVALDEFQAYIFSQHCVQDTLGL